MKQKERLEIIENHLKEVEKNLEQLDKDINIIINFKKFFKICGVLFLYILAFPLCLFLTFIASIRTLFCLLKDFWLFQMTNDNYYQMEFCKFPKRK